MGRKRQTGVHACRLELWLSVVKVAVNLQVEKNCGFVELPREY
jgi:hypothetical protein